MRKSNFREQKTGSPLWVVLFTLLFLLFTASFSSFSQNSSLSEDLSYHLPGKYILNLPITLHNKTLDIPVIRYTSRQAITKGAAIIIGDVQTNGNIDPKLLALAKTLPDWGWNTLLVMPRIQYLEPEPVEVINAENENIAINEAKDILNTEDTSIDATTISKQVDIKPSYMQTPNIPYSKQAYVDFIAALTTSIDSELTKGAGYQVIYAKGQSASAVIDFLLQHDLQFAQALVLNSPYWPNMESNLVLPLKLAQVSIPVLDLVSLSDNIWAKDTIESRRIAAKVGLKSLYRQREIFAVQTLDKHYDHLSEALVSWTYFLGW